MRLGNLLCIGLLFGVAGCGGSVGEIATTQNQQELKSAPAVKAAAGDWPWWRGPATNGHASGKTPPTHWSETKNVRWKSKVPGQGHATPSVWGNHVFVATADAQNETMSVFAFDRATGSELWNTPIHTAGFMHTHTTNSHASATPACDGEHVFVANMVDGGIWVTALNFAGEQQWQTKVGPFSSTHGFGSSPLIYKSWVIVAGDNRGGSFLAALKRDDGEIAWRKRRPNGASFCSPTMVTSGGRDQLLLSGHGRIHSYDPHTGELLWESEGPAKTTASTMVADGERVYAGGGYPQQKLMAIRADGSGEIAWEHPYKVYVPSPIVLGDSLLAIQDNGVARLFDAESGKQRWSKRLRGSFSASPIAAGGHVYLPNQAGTMFVFTAGKKFRQVAVNSLGDAGGMASPVICRGQLFIRTRSWLYCIEESQPTGKVAPK